MQLYQPLKIRPSQWYVITTVSTAHKYVLCLDEEGTPAIAYYLYVNVRFVQTMLAGRI